MKEYQIYIDYGNIDYGDHPDEDLEVLPVIVTANDATEAWEIVNKRVNTNYYKELEGKDYIYIWDCMEEDVIEEDTPFCLYDIEVQEVE